MPFSDVAERLPRLSSAAADAVCAELGRCRMADRVERVAELLPLAEAVERARRERLYRAHFAAAQPRADRDLAHGLRLCALFAALFVGSCVAGFYTAETLRVRSLELRLAVAAGFGVAAVLVEIALLAILPELAKRKHA